MAVLVRQVHSASERTDCERIRQLVFIDEQGVTADEEWDGLDDSSQHFLAQQDEVPVGTARLRFIQKDGRRLAKLERICVLRSARGQGVGGALVSCMLGAAAESGIRDAILEAQVYAIPFYQRYGFVPYGDEFMDARIPHIKMRNYQP